MTRGEFLRRVGSVVTLGFVVLRGAAAGSPDRTPAGRTEPGTLHDRLVAAVNKRRIVTFSYKGLARVAEPHAYGENASKEGVLLAFQTAGESASEPPPGWRTFLVAEIVALGVDDRTFPAARPDYRRGQAGWARVHAEL